MYDGRERTHMPGRTYSLAEIREEIMSLPNYFEQEPAVVTVTRQGQPVMAILPWELYASLLETLEVMNDVELRAAFHRGLLDLAEGKGLAWEEVKKNLDL
jgi:antitoxin YefM